MRTFAQQPKATPQSNSAKTPRPDRAHFGQRRDANSCLLSDNPGVSAGPAAPTRAGHDFGQIPVRVKSPANMQAKLMVNTPGDIYEQEADRVSEQVMRMPDPRLQPACACGGGCPS